MLGKKIEALTKTGLHGSLQFMRVLRYIGILFFLALGSFAQAQNFDPNSTEFDPDKQFSITKYGLSS